MNQLLALETGFYRDAAMRAIKGRRKAKTARPASALLALRK